MNEKTKKFSYLNIAAIGSGFFALSLVWMTYNAFMPLILGKYIQSKGIRGAIMGLDNLIAVFLIPVIGSWSDRIDSRFGKRLPFIAVGMPIAAVLFSVLAFVQSSLFMLLAIDIFFLIAMTFYRAPVIALMPDNTPPPLRTTANGVINFMGGLGTLIALFFIGPLWDKSKTLPFLLSSFFLILSFFFLWFKIDRNPPYQKEEHESEETIGAKSLFDGVRILLKKKYRKKFISLLAIFFFFLGFSGIEAQFTTYATENLGLSGGQAAMTLGFFVLALVVFSIPAGVIGSRIGKQRAMALGTLILASVFVSAPFLKDITTLRVFFVAGGIGWSLILIQAYPLIADMGGTRDIGLMTGLYYFFSMASAIVAPPLLGTIIDTLGFSAMFFTASLCEVIALVLLTSVIGAEKKP